ncbi:ankyrin repeat and SOCS box protein 15 [Pholidichthys leucotaenia]
MEADEDQDLDEDPVQDEDQVSSEPLSARPDFPAALSQADEHGWLPLHRAAVQPVVPVRDVLMYASMGGSLENKTLEGETPLTLAVRAGVVENVKLLLKIGASPHTYNSSRETPLLLAVRAGSPQMVSILLSGGAQVEQVCLKKWTAVHEASQVGSTQILKMLLQNGGGVKETDQHGVTPLGIAAEYSHPEVLELLIRYGADVNAQAPNGDSILFDAAGSGNPEVINILLQNGANANIHNLSSQLPVHRVAYEGHFLALKILFPITTRRALRLSGQSPVHSAANGGHAHCLELLLENGFDVNSLLASHISENYGDMRRTALYFAVSNEDAICTEVLLRWGAKTDLDPLPCLLVAVRSGHYEIVKLLLAARADVNCYFTAVSNTMFPTALQYCLRDKAMMRLLLNHGYNAEMCFCCYHDDDNDGDGFTSVEHQGEKLSFCDFVTVPWMMDLVGRVVSILLEYVGQVCLCRRLANVLRMQEEWPSIQRTIGNPRPLAHLCRLVIRKHLGCNRLSSIQLPARLRDYLLFTEKHLYSIVTSRGR